MEHDCLKPSELPRLTRLYTAYLTAPKKLSEFYFHTPDLAGIKSASGELKKGAGQYSKEMRAAVARILRKQNQAIAGRSLPKILEDNLTGLEAGAGAVVTGQQVGLFGGPAYTAYKAVATLKIAAQLSRQGVNAVPVFWIGGEDHDLAEVNHVFWQTSQGVDRLEWEGAAEQPGAKDQSVGMISLGKGISSLVQRAVEAIGGASADEVGKILASAYRPEETFASSFAKLMFALFAARGLIFLNPLDPELHKLAAPLMRRAVLENAEMNAALLARDKRLEKAGFHSQVKVTDRSTLLFATVDGSRVAIRTRNSGFVAGAKEWSSEQLATDIAAHPESFSPNALLRPLVQDTLLPTVAYIGGPAEVAYFAQNSVLYNKLMDRMPAILPRASFTIVEPQVGRHLARYSLSPQIVFKGRQQLSTLMARQHLPKGVAARFAADQKKLVSLLAGLRKPLKKIDSTLSGALETVERKMLFQFEKLRGKAGRASDFRTGVLTRHEKTILDALFPEHDLQERSLSLLPSLARNGLELLDTLGKHAGLGAAAHRIIRL